MAKGLVKITITDPYAKKLCAEALRNEFEFVYSEFFDAKGRKQTELNTKLDILNMMYRQLTGKELIS